MAKKKLKAPPKKQKRRARELPDTAVPPPPLVKATSRARATRLANAARRGETDVKMAELRYMAKCEYVTDPSRKGVREIYEDERKPYRRSVSYQGMQVWATKDGWKSRRDAYWAEVTEIAISSVQQQVAVQRLKELAKLGEAADYMFEYMVPMTDDDGNVLRYPDDDPMYPGLPKFPLPMPRADQWMLAWLKVDERRMIKRGEATTRSDNLNEAPDGAPKMTSIDPVAQKVSIDRADIRVMSRALLELRQPELTMEPPPEEEDDDDAG